MNHQSLIVTKGNNRESRVPFMNFYTEDGEFVAEIFYIPHPKRMIKITKFHTANLVNNTFIGSHGFGNTGKKYPGLGTACLVRFLLEMKEESTDYITLLSVPQAVIFYRKAAAHLLTHGYIDSWRQGRGLVPLNKIPIWMIDVFGRVSDNSFQIKLK